MSESAPSFAAQHADPSKGFNVVPRWFRASPFWKALKIEHRAILDELFHMVRRLAYRWQDQIDVGRGQFVMTQEAVAERCGATRDQVRAVLEKAEQARILSPKQMTWSDKGKTHRITLVTWLDFEAYDRPQEQKPQSNPQSAPHSMAQSEPQSNPHNNTKTTNTPGETTDLNKEERVAPAPPSSALSGGSSQAVKGKRKSPPAREAIDVSAVCADFGEMKAYLTSGPFNWERHRTSDNDLGVENWNAQEFAGYWWFQVSSFRTHKNIPLNLPPWSKLIGIMSNLRKQMPAQQLVGVIDFVVYYFDVIRFVLRNAGNTVALDESSLVNPLVKSTANNLMRASDGEREQIVAEYRAATRVAAA